MIVIGMILGILIGAVLLFVLLTLVSALAVDPQKIYEKDSPYYRFLLNVIARAMILIGRVRVRTEGLEKLPEGRFLLVQNHDSLYDPIVVWSVLPKRELGYVSKPENINLPVAGRLAHRCGCLAIDRDDPKSSVRTLMTAAGLLKNDSFSLGIFPEGTRNHGSALLPFHNGVFKAAQRSGVPVVIAATVGTHEIKKNWPLHRTEVKLVFCEVIPAEEVQAARTETLGSRTRADIEAVIGDREKSAAD